MSQQIEATKVASKMQELAAALNVDIEDVRVEVQQDFGSKTLDGEAVAERMDDDDIIEDDEDTTEGGDEQSTTEDTSEAGDDDEPTIEDGEVACQCGAVFDSKQSLYGHSSHCDEYESDSIEDAEEESESPEGAENDSISDAELVEAGVKKSNIEDVRKYRSKNGVCSEEDCPYGANNGSDYCASHQGSSSNSKSSEKSSSKKTKEFDDLTSGQQSAVLSLIEDEDKSLEEAVQMV